MAEVLIGVVPPATTISVHSPHHVDTMAAWAKEKRLTKHIDVYSTLPRSLAPHSSAVIVANATRDHEETAAWSLAAGAATLVEKPVALSLRGAQRLDGIAREKNTTLAAALVFLFARYLESFSRVVATAGNVESLRVVWTDPSAENRYGERKRFDASVPVFADVLPHVCSIIDVTLGRPVDSCGSVEVGRGGAAVDLELTADQVLCSVHLERNATRRTRLIQINAGGRALQLDFSSEPGVISDDGSSATADPEWNSAPRPMARMLTAFLAWAVGGQGDNRLDFRRGLEACSIVEQVSQLYGPAMMHWLMPRLQARTSVDADVRYALSEMLQADGPRPQVDVDRGIQAVTSGFSRDARPNAADDVPIAEDFATWLRTVGAVSDRPLQ